MRPSAKEMALRKYVMLGRLGEGAHAKVKLARHLPTGTEVAIKIIPKSGIPQRFLDREVACMKVLRHPNVLQLFQVVDTEKEVVLVLERAHGGDLQDHLLKSGRLGEVEARRLFQQMLAALSHCHARGVAHRDLKPENLLLDKHQNLKLSDFGLSAQFSGAALLQTACGSPQFMAPEILLHKLYSGPAADVWSLGVVLYNMVTGELPFKGTSLGELRTRVLSGVYQEPRYLSQDCRDLLKNMMTLDPQSRSTLDDIIQHPWVGLTNGLPTCHEPSPGQHKAATKAMVRRGYRKEVIDRALSEGRYDPIMATYLMLLARQRPVEEGPDPAISPKLPCPDGAHCASIPEDHRQPEVSGRENLQVGLAHKQDSQKPTTTSGPGIPQEDPGVQSYVSGSGPLLPDACKPSMASRSGPVLREAWGPNTTSLSGPVLREAWGPNTTSLPGPLQEEALPPSTTSLGPQLEGGQENIKNTSSPAPQLSSTTQPPPRSHLLFSPPVPPAETLGHSHSTQSSRGCKARAHRIFLRILKCCIFCSPFGTKNKRVHPAD
ncbi:MAP/microtubule affinity-regulating kinase 3-like [Talpa occidentalis]|uniref:MAP/microtubule affinity-regulating kinase 3-like n=1 Tax=Talpa occidentalis TaxID=50954 RepID=UPI0023F974CF|nr:MAP/microtubule affinity-regulating kinase 3-like [Talpa occidentalis]XP_054544940.1 MAP/microtubule affinity-regulating kinase 3-like [Talpa occidentalis]